MTNQELIEQCYQNEENANMCTAKALTRLDYGSAIDGNEAAYRAALNRLMLTTGKARSKALDDLERIAEEYHILNNQLNTNGGTA